MSKPETVADVLAKMKKEAARDTLGRQRDEGYSDACSYWASKLESALAAGAEPVACIDERHLRLLRQDFNTGNALKHPKDAGKGDVLLYAHAKPAAKVEAPSLDEVLATIRAYGEGCIKLGMESAPTPASVPDGAIVDVFYLGPDDDAFVCEIHGKATIEVIAEIETEIRGNPLEEFEKYGAGTYRLSASYFPGQYGEFGRCELAPGYEIDFISHTPIPADEEPTK